MSQATSNPPKGTPTWIDLAVPDPDRAREFYRTVFGWDYRLTPEPPRAFYAEVFGYTLDRNEDLTGADFTFLRHPDGYEIGGILGSPGATPAWATLFEVADTDIAAKNAIAAGGTAAPPEDSPYGRTAVLTDPDGTEFSVITRP